MDEYEQLALQWCALEENHESIMKLCRLLTRRCGKQQAQLVEDAYHEALRVAPMAMRTYDGRASIRTHLLGSMRWYIWKMLTKAAKEMSRQTSIEVQHRCNGTAASVMDHDELTARDQVEYLMGRLPSAQAELLKWRFIDGLSIKDIAELLDCASSTACSYVQDALEAARGIDCTDTRRGDL